VKAESSKPSSASLSNKEFGSTVIRMAEEKRKPHSNDEAGIEMQQNLHSSEFE